MKTKERQEAGESPNFPRNTTEARVNNTGSDQDKIISPQAVTSVASQYGISASLFRQWLESRGFIIQEA